MKATILYECPSDYTRIVKGVFTSKKALADTAKNIIENRIKNSISIDGLEDIDSQIHEHLQQLILENKTNGLPLGELEIEEFTVNEVIADE